MKSLIKPLGRSLTLAIMTSALLDVYALATDATEAPKPAKSTASTASTPSRTVTTPGQVASGPEADTPQAQAETGLNALQKQAKPPQNANSDEVAATEASPNQEPAETATTQPTPATPQTAQTQAAPSSPTATPTATPAPAATATPASENTVAGQQEDETLTPEAAVAEQQEGERSAQQAQPAPEDEPSGLNELAIAKQSATQEKVAQQQTPTPEVAAAPDPDIIPTHRIVLPEGSRFFRNACTASSPAASSPALKTPTRPVVSTVPLTEVSTADSSDLALKKQPKLSAGRANPLLKFMQGLELEPFQAANADSEVDSLPAVAVSDGSTQSLDRQEIGKNVEKEAAPGDKATEPLADIGQHLPSLKVATPPTAVTTLPPLPEFPALAQTSLPSAPRLISNPVPLESTTAEVSATASDQPIAALVDCDGATATQGNITPFQWAGMTYPLPFAVPLTSGFGWRVHPISGDRRFHKGIDLAAPMGTPVLAATSGRVVAADNISGYGLTVVIEGAGRRNLYAHLSGMAVRPGTEVKAGTVIGWVGSTGNSTGPHLHFETQVLTGEGWMAVNPLSVSNTLVAQSR